MSRNVRPSRAKVARIGDVASVSPGPTSRGGSGTRRSSGSMKTSHHTPTLANDSFVAATVLGSPNVPGLRIHARLMTSRMPPPR